MKKLLRNVFVAALAMMSVSATAQTVTFDASVDKGTKTASDPGEDQITKDGVTIAVSNGAMNLQDQYRCYKGATFTVTSTIGNITKVELTCTAEGDAKYGPGCFTDATAGSYSYEAKAGTWTGDAATFTMTASTNQVRMNTVVVTIGSGSGSGSQGQAVAVGIARPTFTAADGTVTYDTWNYIETVDKFNKSADGLAVKFFQTPEIEATIVKDEAQEGGYEVKQVCHQGEKNISVDYVWKLNCTAGGANKHNEENVIGSENWAFGFDLTVAEGKTFNVSAIDFDLLVEQNPAYRIRIMQGETEVYNSTWITKTGGYNNMEWGAGSYCRIEKDTVLFVFEAQKDGNPINYQAIQYYPGFEEKFGVMTPLGDLKLTAGTYRVIADVDYNKDSSKAMSFDNFTIEGTLEGGSSEPEPTQGDFVGIVRPTFTAADGTVTYDTWNYIETVDKFNKSADGLAVKFFQTPEIEATIVKDEAQEGGYEVKQVCHQGEKNISVDYVWKLNCTAGGANKHNEENVIGSENWAFGFDLTVAEGKTFNVSAIDFDLLVEQNPAYRIRIMQGETEVYNSTWITKTGGYNNMEWGAGSYCRIEKDTVLFVFEAQKDGNPINYQAIQYYPGFEEKFGVMTPLGDLKLTAGTYRVIADVDYNKDSAKAMSFDNFTLEGELVDASAISVAKTTVNTEGIRYNLAGQKVGNDYKGIVIMNGKKFMQK